MMDTSEFSLDTGVSIRLTDAAADDEETFNSQHTMQILSTKQISPPTSNGAQARYRIILSDGQYFIQAMLATQLNDMITEGTLDKNVIVVLEKMSCNFMSNKRYATR
jgi:replication factor A1